MPYFEVGNENYGPDYDERYALFHDAIKKAYPDIKIIASENEAANSRPSSRPLEIVDEHYYKAHHWFNSNSTRYDSYPRDGYHVFVGEFAVKRRKGNILNAISEAAFMIGIERNADIVDMAAYAPLVSNANMPSSHPIGIYADSSRCYGTPSYYVQKMFGENYSPALLDCKVDAPACITDYDNRPVKQNAIFANALLDGDEVVIKIVNYAKEPRSIDLQVVNGSFRAYARRTMLTSPHPYAENTLDNPCAVAPREDVVPLDFPVAAPAHSLQVLRLLPSSSKKEQYR
jgi:alpha-L-arabinofuranosidase